MNSITINIPALDRIAEALDKIADTHSQNVTKIDHEVCIKNKTVQKQKHSIIDEKATINNNSMDIKKITIGFIESGVSKSDVKTALLKFKVDKLSQLKPEQYESFIEELKKCQKDTH